MIETLPQTKRCSKCKEILPTTTFAKDSSKCSQLRSECKNCQRAYRKVHYEAYKEEHKAYQRAWQQAHKEEGKARCRVYHAAHKEQRKIYHRAYRETHLEQRAKLNRQWRKEHPEQARVLVERRRARKLQAFGASYTTAEHIHLRWQMHGGRCWICGDKATQTDHVKPLSKGGAHLPCNLRPICKPCNNRKHAQWPISLERRNPGND